MLLSSRLTHRLTGGWVDCVACQVGCLPSTTGADAARTCPALYRKV